MKVSFIVNPTKSKSHQILHQLNQGDYDADFDVLISEHSGHAKVLSASAAEQDRLVVAVGGDGTVHECVNGIMQAGGGKMSIIPSGTGNDVSRTLDCPRDVQEFFQWLKEPPFRSVDVGVVRGEETQYFLNIVDAGMGPAVIENMAKLPKRWPTSMKYSFSILSTFFRYRNLELTVTWDGGFWTGPSKLVALANCKFFGNGLGIAPDADPADGLLDLIIVGNVSVWEYLKYLPKIKSSQKIDHPEVLYARGSGFKIEGKDRIEHDGELGMRLPVEVELAKDGLQFLSTDFTPSSSSATQ